MKKYVKESLYIKEFPDYDDTLYCPVGFEDASYHNDVMPHVTKRLKQYGKDIEVNIWQDYKDVSKRENDYTKRYIVTIKVDDDIVTEFPSDKLSDVRRFIGNLDDMIKKSIAQNNLNESAFSDQEIKEFISTNILTGIVDAGLQTVLRYVLFSSTNKIDWQDFYRLIQVHMPEKSIKVNVESKILNVNNVLNKVLEGKSLTEAINDIKGSIKFKSWGKDGKVKSYHFDSAQDLKAAWESGVDVPDNTDPVSDVVVNGKLVYKGTKPESTDSADTDEVWFEDILTYCDIDIW